jgi:copper transport protein
VPLGGTSDLLILARWLHFVGFALSFGVLLARFLVAGAVWRRGAERAPVRRRLQPLVNVGIAALLAAEVLWLGVAATSPATAGGGATGLGRSEGQLLGQRLAVALLLWLAVGATQGGRGRDRWLSGVAWGMALVLAALDGASASPLSGVQQGGAVAVPWWVVAAVGGVHVLAMAVWLGAVVALSWIWPMPEIVPQRGALVRRTGRVALSCVALLALSGTALAALHAPEWGALVATTYGRTLLVKLLVFASVLVLARIGMRRGAEAPDRWWRAEAFGIAGVLVLAAALVSLPAP